MVSIPSFPPTRLFPLAATADRPIAETTTAPADLSDAESERLQRARDAYDLLESTRVDVAEQRKERARQKLEEARAEIDMLKRFGFPPDVVARRAAQLGIQVSAAAEDFARATEAGISVSGISAIATVRPPSDGTEAEADAEEPAAPLPSAYRETENERRQPARITQADRQTAEDFRSTLQEIRQMLEKALRELQRKDGDASSEAGASLAAIGDALSGLAGIGNTAIAVPAVSITI